MPISLEPLVQAHGLQAAPGRFLIDQRQVEALEAGGANFGAAMERSEMFMFTHGGILKPVSLLAKFGRTATGELSGLDEFKIKPDEHTEEWTNSLLLAFDTRQLVESQLFTWHVQVAFRPSTTEMVQARQRHSLSVNRDGTWFTRSVELNTHDGAKNTEHNLLPPPFLFAAIQLLMDRGNVDDEAQKYHRAKAAVQPEIQRLKGLPRLIAEKILFLGELERTGFPLAHWLKDSPYDSQYA
jgi:hypothetical protein